MGIGVLIAIAILLLFFDGINTVLWVFVYIPAIAVIIFIIYLFIRGEDENKPF